MKKNSLTTAVVAGIAGVAGFVGLANAVDLNPDGVGQVLIYPYYTVNKGQNTLLSVVNTADVGKAVKVRFLEGYNSREVLDFNLFLSPYDVWTAAVTQVSADGGAQINTVDTSCVDYIPNWPYPFSKAAYTGGVAGPGSASYGADKGPQDITRTREGYVEMIAMGDIIPGSALDKATVHKQNGQPNGGKPSCAAPVGDDAVTASNLVPPTSGLFGSGAIINVDEGTFYSYNADAIDGFTEQTLYTQPSSLKPTLQQANTASIVATGVARSYVFTEGGSLLTVDFARGEDAVSAVFMADALYNEYSIEQGTGAASDWVVTFPTKRFYVDKILYPSAITSPFAQAFGAPGVSNVELSMGTFDREEGSSETVPPRCPSPPDDSCFLRAPYLSYEVNVITFTSVTPTASTVLGSKLFKSVNPFGPNGWAVMNLSAGDGGAHVLGGGVAADGVTPIAIPGLPATGFYANNVINANAQPGKLSNYSGVWRHRAHRSCTGNDPACS
ncbi:MAG: hypothetical protein GXC76_03915 [Rhodanobacteraceae bacterium]|jgi:hypothetical protein|nr:hypothetical protein [Rhodanobacteraceae bacterium]